MVIARKLVFLGVGASALLLFCAILSFIFPANWMLPLNKEYAKALSNFTLTDSLPDLDVGMRRFEAFRLYDSSGSKSNLTGSLSYSRSIQRIVKLEYLCNHGVNDSLVILNWVASGKVIRQTFSGEPAQKILLRFQDTVRGSWQSRNVALISFPRTIVRAFPKGIRGFDRIEGTTIHEVSSVYSMRCNRFQTPDTSYFAPYDYSDVDFLVRGDNLAIVNGSKTSIKLAIYSPSLGWKYLKAHRNRVSVFRKLLHPSDEFMVAYTAPDSRFLPLPWNSPSREFFYLER
jgi:hypothetical protein